MLTAEQQAAVDSPHKDTIVIAGAGSGKTRVLIERVKAMIKRGIDPQEIMLITFTRKAASEIRERLSAEYAACPAVRLGTFHSLALEMLQDKDLTVVNEWVAKDIARRVNRTLTVPVSPEKIDSYRFHRALGTLKHNDNTRRAVSAYERFLRNEKSIDFMGMMLEGVEVASKLGGFHVLVDEAQDTDDLQWEFVKRLRQGKTLFTVGDGRQQLYVWRNVNPDTFWLLPGKRFALTKTFRFGGVLADFTNELAAQAGYRGHEVEPFDPNAKSRLYYTGLKHVSEMAAKAYSSTAGAESVAVLCRYNSQVDEYREAISRLGVKVGEQVEIDHRRVFAMLQYLHSPWSDSLRRSFLAFADSAKLLPAICALSTESAGTYIESWLDAETKVSDVLAGVSFCPGCKDSLDWWEQNYGSFKLADAINDFATRDEEVDYTPGVRVMTVHGSKGLEFDHVFFPLAPARKFKADEWRVAYVACTRAKKTLHVSGTDNPVAEIAMKFAEQPVLSR